MASQIAGTPRPTLGDLIAGLSVFLALVPQALAYAELAGMPPAVGLMAGTLPLILAAFFASSPYLQTGPTALSSLLVVGALAPLATRGTDEYVALGALLAIMVGAIRIAFGTLRLGIVAYLVSQPVLLGFTTGSAFLIVGSQIPAVVGRPAESSRAIGRLIEAIGAIDEWHWPSVGFAAMSVVIIQVGRRIHPLIPGVLIAVGMSWLLNEQLGLGAATVGDIPEMGLSLRTDLPFGSIPSLIIPAIAIAVVGFAEPASIARTLAAVERQSWSANREFVSQGVANLTAGMIGTYPVGGSLGRTSLNHRAGADTRWAGAITGLVMLAMMPLVGMLASIPRAALGAVVITAVLSLLRLDRLPIMWSWSRPQAATYAVTLLATILLDPRVDIAILIGIAVSVGVHLWRELRIDVRAEVDGKAMRISPYGVLWFGSVPLVVEPILALVADHPEVNDIDIDLSGLGRLDLTGAFGLVELVDDLRGQGDVTVRFSNVPPHAERLFDRVVRVDAQP